MPKGMGQKRGSAAFNPIDVHVGQRLRTRRTLLGLSQMAVAESLRGVEVHLGENAARADVG
jgi:hypothetical protein